MTTSEAPREKRCPRCRFPLASLANDDAVLDTCAVCHGAFFEPHRLVARFGEESAPSQWIDERCATARGATTLRCPIDDAALHAYALSWTTTARSVELDVCPTCRGVWLDDGEGAVLADVLHAHGEARKEGEKLTAKGYFFQLFTGFPVELWNPTHAPAIVTRALVGLLALCFLAQFALAVVDEALLARLIELFALRPSTMKTPLGLHTVVTYGFLHGGFAHVLGNAYMLWIFGDNVEERLGRRRYLLLYGAALVAGGLAYGLFEPRDVQMIGASGAVSGVMAAYFVMFPRVRLRVVWVGIPIKLRVSWAFTMWFAFQIVMNILHVGSVAWLAHIGGALAGLVLGLVDQRALARDARRAAEERSVLLPRA